MVCIDTGVVIDFFREESYAVKHIENFSRTEEIFISSITVFELLKGALRAESQKTLEKTQAFVNRLRILYFDNKAAEIASGIFEDLRRKGLTVDPLDLLIASTSIANNQKLLTNNKKHFGKISALDLA
ncbi:type II toxin-antitoxin system VapC family toxin [Candidatus Woesearchaeota archaeon]|nr:type II toxin-antitoxin system VapC family toxin [Candidatus Woesearchaeota archaeon]